MIVRNPAAPCADHEVPVFIHQFAGSSSVSFQSKPLAHGDSFDFVFADAKVVHYYCAIHGPTMNGTVQVTAGEPASASVSVQDNKFVPSLVQVHPGGSINWQNDGNDEHIVFSAGGGAPNFCLNGRAFVGNTPTVVGDSGERLRWYLFNLDVSGIWHNFHPHSIRWALSAPPGGASDVHGISSLETFITDTEIPPAMRLPYALEQFQWNPLENACRLRIRGDFLFHCHIEEHMMAGLAGLVRARQYVWISDELSKSIEVELPFDDGMNACPPVDILHCLLDRIASPATSGHGHSSDAAEHLPAAVETRGMPGMGEMTGMGGMGGMGAMPAEDILEAATEGR